MLQTFDLTNEQQLLIMNKVKTQEWSVDKAQRMASVLSSQKKEGMDFDSTKAFTFGVIRFPFGFSEGNGIKNSMQIDFRKQSIYFMDKITIHVILLFRDIIKYSSDEYNYGIKLLTKHTKIRFATNIENKPEIERLISTIILQNDLAMNIPGTGPSLDHPVSDVALSPGATSPSTIMTLINQRKVLKEGIVEKKGNAAIVRWSKRFLRVEEREFSYYDPNNLKDPLNVVQINPSTEIEAIKSESNTFVITVVKRSYYFRVKKYETPERTEGERNAWLLAFREACSRQSLIHYWIENRNCLFQKSGKCSPKSPSPPIDYDFPDKKSSLEFKRPEYLEMESFTDSPKKPSLPVPTKKPQKEILTDLTTDGPSSLSFPSPKPLGHRPPPPPPPPLPPMLEHNRKSTDKLKAHCETKLKHFFVPKVFEKEMKDSVWTFLTDVSPKLDMKLLEQHFTEEKRHLAPLQQENKSKTYMDPKKAQNILILMKSNNFLQTVRNLSDFINSIQPPDETEMEIIQILQKYQPTEDEIEQYQKMMKDNVSLGQADKIMATMSLIPVLRKRLELSLNLWTYESQYTEFTEYLDQLRKACDEILNSKKFARVLEYLLAILNLMNTSGRSNDESVMKAFHLKFLSQLKLIQNANGFTLLKMLVSQLKKSEPELLDFHKELNHVKFCENMSIKAIHASIEVLKKDLKSIGNNSKKIPGLIKNPTDSENEFFQTVTEFCKIQQKKLVSTEKVIDGIQKTYGNILNWFSLSNDTSSEDIFHYLISFLEDFVAAL